MTLADRQTDSYKIYNKSEQSTSNSVSEEGRKEGRMRKDDKWGGAPVEIEAELATTSDEVKQGWLLKPENKENGGHDHERNIDGKKKKRRMMSKILGSLVSIRSLVVVGVAILVALIIVLVKIAQRNHHHLNSSPPHNYTTALHQALLFFNAQRCMYYSLLYPIFIHSPLSLSLIY